MKKSICAALLLSLLTGTSGWAMDPLSAKNDVTPSQPLQSCSAKIDQKKAYMLADLIQIGLCNNPLTRESWSVFLEQQERLGRQKSTYLPSVGATAGYTLSKTETSGATLPGGFNRSGSTGGVGLSLEYLLFDFGQRSASVEQAKQNLTAANFSHSLSMQNVLYSVVQNYYDYFAARAVLNATQESEESARVNLEAAQLREKVGRAPITEKLQAETAYSQAKLQRVQAENIISKSKGELMQVLGLNPQMDLNIIVPNEGAIVDAKFLKSTEQIMDYASKAHPSILQAESIVKGEKAGFDLERARRFPTVSTVAELGRDRGFSGSAVDTDNNAVGVRLTFPLFTGFSRTYDIQTARQEIKTAEARLDRTRNEVQSDVWNAYQDFKTAGQNIGATEDVYRSAVEAEKSTLARYKAGKGSLIDLLTSQAQLAQARQGRVQAKYNWFITKANLLRAAGDIDIQEFTE